MGRKLNLIGQQFGLLTVVADSGDRVSGNVIWTCRCACGNVTHSRTAWLRRGEVVSCGCNRRSKSKTNLAGDPRNKFLILNDTNGSRIRSQKIPSNNTSGVVGVYKNTDGRFIAYIYYQRHRYHLGSFASLEAASAARREAEIARLADFCAWYDTHIRNKEESVHD